jgi:hypothetical protein
MITAGSWSARAQALAHPQVDNFYPPTAREGSFRLSSFSHV